MCSHRTWIESFRVDHEALQSVLWGGPGEVEYQGALEERGETQRQSWSHLPAQRLFFQFKCGFIFTLDHQQLHIYTERGQKSGLMEKSISTF